MKDRRTEIRSIIVSIIVMAIGMFFYYNVSNYIMAIALIVEAIYLAILFRNKYKTFINSCSIFSAIWFFTIGLSTLQLHQLQQQWKIQTFIYLELAYVLFILGYMIYFKLDAQKKEKNIITKKQYFSFITLFFWMVFLAFVLEVFIRGYIPIFDDNMSSYQDFSVSGIHYFTVSCCLMLPITYIFLKHFETNKSERIYLLLINLICLAIPILIVSRQLLIMEVILTFLVIIYFNPKKENKLITCAVIGVLIAWSFVGSFRNQNEEYLRQALEIQSDTKLSVENMQMYMYITFNYDNFNANVGKIQQYSYGTKSFFPIFALTGIKFLIPEIEKRNLVRVIDVYNTYPILITPYEDFGGIGILVYMIIVGILCNKLDNLSDTNPINILLKMLVKYSLLFSFFISYFSNATMWFYVIVLLIFRRIFFENKILEVNWRDNEKSTSTNVHIQWTKIFKRTN